MSSDLPLPGQRIFGRIVVASTWVTDVGGLLLLVNDRAPYYGVADIGIVAPTSWAITHETAHVNINPATEEYAQRGGDY